MLSTLDSRFKLFFRGLTTPLRALETIFDYPKLIFLSLLPVLVTLMLVAGIIYACLAGAWAQGMNVFKNYTESSSHALSGILVVLAGLLVLYFLFHALNLLISLVASPFNDTLSEATEKALGSTYPDLGFMDLVKVFFLDLRKTLLSLMLTAAFSILGFIPLVGLVSIFGFALILTLTFITYPQSRRKQGVLDSVSWIIRNFEASLGFGLTSLVLFGIPVINVFALPISVVGGTLLYLENEKSKSRN